MILNKALRIFIPVLASCVLQLASADSGTITITPDAPIDSHFQYWEDPGADAGIDKVLTIPESEWQLKPSGKATFGITGSAYWLRLSVQNQTRQDQLLIAELAYPQLDDVVFHEFSGNTLLREFRTGDTRPFYPSTIPICCCDFNSHRTPPKPSISA